MSVEGPGGAWREAALELFGTVDIAAMRAQLDAAGSTLTREELRVRRGVLFLALAEEGSYRNLR